MQAKAAVLRDPAGPYTLEQVELRELPSDGVLVRIVGAGFCHTDVLPRAPESPAPPPIIPGHEGSGVVEAVGADVTAVAAGDHVVLSFDYCGQCESCKAGNVPYCDTFIPRNLTGRALDGSAGTKDADGADVAGHWFGQSSFASHAIANERNVVKVDPSLPLEQLGPLGCGIQTGAGSVLISMNVQPNTSIVIFGCGAVGLAALMAAVVAGATTIVAVDLNAERLALATELGATHTINGAAADLVEQVHGLTGVGAHYTFDTTGVPDVIRNAIACTRLNGIAGLVGIQTGDLVLGPMDTVGRTIMSILEGGANPQTFVPRMLELWQTGRFPFDRLITTFPLDQINEAEQASLGGKVIKPVLIP